MTAPTPRDVLLAHEPGADYGYEWMVCSCGWRDADAVGLRQVDPDSKTWLEHILRAFDEAAALTRREPLDVERLARALPEAIETAVAVHEAAMQVNRQEGFPMFDPAYANEAFYRAVAEVLAAEYNRLEAADKP